MSECLVKTRNNVSPNDIIVKEFQRKAIHDC